MLKISNLTGFGGSGSTGTTTDSGDMFAWGGNGFGQAGGGGGTADPVLTPTETDSTDNIIISYGSFSMALHMGFIIDGELYTTGYNQYGQLGFGDIVDKNAFTKVVTNGDATDFALGQSHTLTIRSGKVNGCGRNNLDQLTSSQSLSGIKTLAVLFEPSATGTADASKVYASRNSGGVLTTSNEAWVWGSQVGYLSSESTINSSPVNVTNFVDGSVLDGINLTSLALGDEHLIILDESGNAYTTSQNNDYGACGRGLNEDAFGGGTGNRPVDTDPLAPVGIALSGASKIAAGRYTSYIIAGGILFAAGSADSGQMGATSASSFNNEFIDIGGGITDWIDVQAGENFVIAQRQDGTLYHSGINDFAQQGNNSTGSNEFGFVQIDGGGTAKSYGAYVATRRTIYGLS